MKPNDAVVALRVTSTTAEAGVAEGSAFTATGPRCVIGRLPSEVDLLLGDPTVSRVHAALEFGDGVHVEHLASNANSTWVDGTRLYQGDRRRLNAGGGRVQIGGVLMEYALLADTVHVTAFMADEAPVAPSNVRLEVSWEAGECTIKLNGRSLPLPPRAARMLGELGARPGEVVCYADLLDEMGMEASDQPALRGHASRIRRAMGEALEAGAVEEAGLRAEVQQVVLDLPSTPSGLLRVLVQNRHNHGYVLNLPGAAVEVVGA